MSTHFVWDGKRLKLHLTSKNQEHQKVIDLINDLYERNQAKPNKEMLFKALDEIQLTLKELFEKEEAYHLQSGNSRMEHHQKFHLRFMNQFQNQRVHFERSNHQKIPDSFFAFMTLWLSADIKHLEMNDYPSVIEKSA